MKFQKGNKYHNQKVYVNGIKFDSKLEHARWMYLSSLEKRGEIQNLVRQKEFLLTRRRYCKERRTGKTGKPLKPHLYVYERACVYKADFCFLAQSITGEWKMIVEDTKGEKTTEYILKRKMMLEKYDIQVMDITSPCTPVSFPPELAD